MTAAQIRKIPTQLLTSREDFNARASPTGSGTSCCLKAFSYQEARLEEDLMERRAFLQLLCFGMGMVSAATATKALTLVEPLTAPDPHQGSAPEPGFATPEDMDHAQVEKAYYGHWRRVGRRHYRRAYRRHYYY
jgi:hypothetical protein